MEGVPGAFLGSLGTNEDFMYTLIGVHLYVTYVISFKVLYLGSF